MQNNVQKTMTIFFAEAKMIEGAEGAILEMSDEINNGVILSGRIYGKDTNEKINALGRKYGLLILAQELSISYEKPKGREEYETSE